MATAVEQHLQQFKEQKGEAAWREEVKRLAIQAIQTSPKHEAFWKELTKKFDWIDWDQLKKESHGLNQTMANLLKDQMPGVQSQAQYNAVIGAFDAVKLVLNAILVGDKSKETEARKALELAFEATAKATEITIKLAEVPEAATSEASEDFKNSPIQFHEYDIQRKLLRELEKLSNLTDLNVWYVGTKSERDRVVTQDLRNILIDAIRTKKNKLEKAFIR